MHGQFVDGRALTVECANSTGGPEWGIADESVEACPGNLDIDRILARAAQLVGVDLGVQPARSRRRAPARFTGSAVQAFDGTFALPPGHFYGDISGPRQSHGGVGDSEQAAVLMIQQRLQELGYAPKPPWPLPLRTDHHLGDINGPATSHGGNRDVNAVEIIAAIRYVQQRMIQLGFVPGISDPSSGWADGLFEQPTIHAVASWQRALFESDTTRFGEVWPQDYDRL